MKKIKKSIIAVGLAGIMFGAAAGLAGCEGVQSDISSDELNSYLVTKNTFIVVSENGIDTLHKGDIVVPYKDYGQGHSFVFPTILKFNCGKELQTYQFVAYTQCCPTEEKYDQICECAREINLQNQNEDTVSQSVEYTKNPTSETGYKKTCKSKSKCKTDGKSL